MLVNVVLGSSKSLMYPLGNERSWQIGGERVRTRSFLSALKRDALDRKHMA